MMSNLSKMGGLLVDRLRWMSKGRSSSAAISQTLMVRLLILVVNTVTGMITARTLAPIGRGEQTAMGAWVLLLPAAMLIGLPNSLLYNLKRHPEEKSEIFSAALVLTIGLSGIATLVGIVMVPVWLKSYSPEVVYLARWLMLCVPLVMFTEIVRATLEANDQFAVANQLRFLPPLMTFCLLGILALTGHLTPFTANLSYFIPAIPVLIWMSLPLRQLFKIRVRRFKASARLLLSYGVRSYGIDLITSLLVQFQQVLVITLLSPTNLGLYAIALTLSNVLNVFQASIVTVMFPKAAARPVAEVVELIGRAARISTVGTLLLGLVAISLGPLLLELFYGKAYLEAVPLFRLLVIEVVLAGTTGVLAQAFMALGRPGTVAVLQGFGVALNYPLMALLIPHYGLMGAGFALLGATTARLGLILASYPLVLKVRPPSLLITKEDLQMLKQRLLHTS
jgi:O-antigen/teichoic acid export membrane protein